MMNSGKARLVPANNYRQVRALAKKNKLNPNRGKFCQAFHPIAVGRHTRVENCVEDVTISLRLQSQFAPTRKAPHYGYERLARSPNIRRNPFPYT
jgi:hypothetical protein